MKFTGDALVRLLARPSGVVVVGASANRDRPSGRPLRYLVEKGYAGRLLAVNPKHSEVMGVRAVASAADVPKHEHDVAVVTLPASLVTPALRDLDAAGVSAAVVVGSGFEDPASGPRHDLAAFLAESTMRVVGPNCVGALASASSSYLTFSSVLRTETPRVGRVGLVTQSGALGNSLLQTLVRRHVGLAQWVSTGNEQDVGAMEVVAGMLAQPGIDAVGMFLEGVTDLDWLPAIERQLADRSKSLFVLKGAQSSFGRAAAAGHTGRVVGSADASRAILAEVGAREVPTVSALADCLVLAGAEIGRRLPEHPRVGVVTVSGAAGVVGADGVGRSDRLTLSEPVDAVLDIDSALAVANPLDVPFLDRTAAFAGAVRTVAADEGTDVVVAIESGLAHDRAVLAEVLTGHDRSKTPLVLTSLSEDDPVPSEAALVLGDAGIAYVPTIDRAIAALDATARAMSTPETTAHHEGPTPAVRGLEELAARVPASFPWAPWRVLEGTEQPTALSAPVVLKAAGRTIEHRSDVGAIRVVLDPADLADAWKQVSGVCAGAGDVVVAQELAPCGFEVMVAVLHDREFGVVAYLRPGGVFAEMMDVQTVLWSGWPAERRRTVLASSRLGELLDGYRGGTVHDVAALAAVVDACLAVSSVEIPMIELNPVVVHELGVSVLDAVVQLASPA